jgi:hypothetical protein
MMDKLIALVGGKPALIIFSLPMALFGVFHFLGADKMAGMVPVPGGAIWVYLTGLCLIAGAVGIITNLNGLGSTAAFLLGVLVLVFAFTIHLPGMMAGGQGAMSAQVSFLKDIIITGGAWAIAHTLKS